MDLFREKHTPQTECGPSQKARPACSFISCCLYFPTASFWGVNSLKRDEHLMWARPICSQEWGGLQPYTSHFPETLGQSFTFLIMEGDLAHQLQDAKRFLNSLRNATSFLLASAPSSPGSFYMLPGGALKYRITDWHDTKNTSKGLTKFFKWFGLLCQIESDISSRMLASLSSLTGRLVLLFLQPKSTSMHVLKESLEMFGYRWPTWVLLLSRALLSGPRFLTDMYK